MTDWTRRAFLCVSAGTFGIVAGCLDGGDGTPTTSPGGSTGPSGNESTDRTPGDQTPTGPRPERAHVAFNHAKELHRLDAAFPQRDVASFYLALLTSADHAAASPTDRFEHQQARSFVADTDFSQAAVVVLQDRRSSSHPDLNLRDTGRDGDTATIEATYPTGAATADITTDTLLVRLPTDDGTVRAASATIRPQHGEPVRLSTLNAYDTVPEFDPPGDLVLRNRDCANAPLSVTVTYDGDLFFRDSVDLPAASLRRVDGLLTHPGEWRIAVRGGGKTVAQSWSLTDSPPGDLLVDVAGDGRVTLSQRSDGVDENSIDTCETNGYPYESSDSTENLDRPVDLWVLDRSDGGHHLTVTIRDGDTEAFSGEFATREGYDKAKRAGLLAKKTTYTVDVTTDDGRNVSESVTVREGVKKLTVRVTESGELAVSVS